MVTPLRRSLMTAAIALAVLAVLAVLTPSSVAHAQPSLAEIEAQIDESWRELEPVIEDHNRVRSKLKENKKKSDKLEEKLAPLELRMNLAMEALSDVAVHYYKGGNVSAFNALLSSGSPATFADQLAVLDMLARDQRAQIEEANDAKLKFEEQKAEVDALIEKQEEQEAELAERKEEIETELERLEGLLAEEERAQREAEGAQQEAQSNTGTGTGVGEATGGCPAMTSSGPGNTAAQFACAQIGKPYQWGATGPGAYDCSGLTQAAWNAAGVSLTHYTGAQWNEGRPVSRSEAIPGDLVFFYSDLSHMGLYVGNGMMVDAPRAGKDVAMRSIDTMPIAGFRRPG